MSSSRRPRSVAACALLVAALGAGGAARAAVLHPTIVLRAQSVDFYAGHLVLDGNGGAWLDDGVLRVAADRIIVDLRAQRYVAAGNVSVTGLTVTHADALGVDLSTHQGVLVDTAAGPLTEAVNGAVVGGPLAANAPAEPLALPDIGFERPYARASQAVAHLGADVRLANARIVVPGGESVALPSYVYTFATDPGYTTSNISTNGEDLPIYFGSTTNSIQGVHFFYNTSTKVGIGLDNHFVWGDKAYVLMAASPIFGPIKGFDFTWLEHINDHVSQTFESTTASDLGTINSYDLKDSIHRSFLELDGDQGLGAHQATLAWQSFDQPFGWPSAASRPSFHLRSEYGYTHVPDQSAFAPFPPSAVLPRTVWHSAFEGYLTTQTWNLGRNVSLYGIGDLRDEADDLPHRQVSQTYTLTLQTIWNPNVSTTFSQGFMPFFDAYPSERVIYHTRLSSQSLSFRYDHGDPFSLTLVAVRSTVSTDNPAPSFAYPWTLEGDVRFRVTPSLSLDLSRIYYFGFNGQRYGALGVQILP